MMSPVAMPTAAEFAALAPEMKVVAPWRGSAGVQQLGRQAWVRPGGWAIYDTTSDYEVANPERVEHLIFEVR